MEAGKVELEQSEEVVFLGESLLDKAVVYAIVAEAVVFGIAIGRNAVAGDWPRVFLSASLFVVALAVLLGSALLMAKRQAHTSPWATPTEYGLIVKGQGPRRATVAPWELVKGVSGWDPGRSRGTAGRTGMLIEFTGGAIPWRDDDQIRLVGKLEELQYVLDRMEMYSGRKFKL